jgi:hypothetical protein
MWRLDSDPPPSCQSSGTTESWLFNPSGPDKLIRIVHETLASDIFCGSLSWDGAGKLVVVGGINPVEGFNPAETYRFNPRVLPLTTWPVVVYPDPPEDPYLAMSPCWETVGDMSIGRYYPTLLRLLDRILVAGTCVPAMRSAHLVLGGPPFVSGTEGNEVWELLQNGSDTWECPLLPETMTTAAPHWMPAWAGNNERYTLEPEVPPGGPPYFDLLDSYPRALQLEDGQIFVAGDVRTQGTQSPPGNVPGTSWGGLRGSRCACR